MSKTILRWGEKALSMLLIAAMVMVLVPISALPAAAAAPVAEQADPLEQLGFDTNPPSGQAEREKNPVLGMTAEMFPVNELLINRTGINLSSNDWGLWYHNKAFSTGSTPTASAGMYGTVDSLTSATKASRSVALDWDGDGKKDETAEICVVAEDFKWTDPFTNQPRTKACYFYYLYVFDTNSTLLVTSLYYFGWPGIPVSMVEKSYNGLSVPLLLDNLIDIDAGDLDGDGRDEVVIAYYYNASVLSNDLEHPSIDVGIVGSRSQGYTKIACPTHTNGAYGASYFSLAVGDINRDGLDDIAFASSSIFKTSPFEASIPELRVWYGERDLDRISAMLYGKAELTLLDRKLILPGVEIADLDGDYVNEIIVAGRQGSVVTNYSKYTQFESGLGVGLVYELMGQPAIPYMMQCLINASQKMYVYKHNNSGALVRYGPTDLPTRTYSISSLIGTSQVIPVRIDPMLAPYLFCDGQMIKNNAGTWETAKNYAPYQLPSNTTEAIVGIIDVAVGDIDGDRREDIVFKSFIMRLEQYDQTDPKKLIAASTQDICFAFGANYSGTTALKYASSTIPGVKVTANALPLSFALPNTDEDTVIGQYVGYEFAYTDPAIVAAMASVPYFEDVAKDFGEVDFKYESKTTFTTQRSTGSGTTSFSSVSAGAYFGYEHNFTVFGVPVASFEFEASIGGQWQSNVERTVTRTESTTYTATAGTDSVVLTSVPMDIYTYKVYSPTNQTGAVEENLMEVYVPYNPVVQVVSLETYNKVRQQNPDSGLPDLAKDVFMHTAGDPLTYPRTANANDLVRDGGKIVPGSIWPASSFMGVGDSTGAITQSLSMESTTEKQNSSAVEYSFKMGGGVGGVKAGVYTDQSYGSGQIEISTEGFEYSGTVHGMSAEARNLGYRYNWKLVQYIYDYGTGDDANTFPVITYAVENPQRPPMLPDYDSIYLKARTSTSITLAWPQTTDELGGMIVSYDVYTVPSTGALPIFVGSAVWDTAAQEHVFVLNGLAQKNTYRFAIKAKRTGPVPTTSLFSPEIVYKTPSSGIGEVTFGNLSDTYVTGATASVTFNPTITETVQPYRKNYQWQILEDGKFVDIVNGGDYSGAKEKAFTVNNPLFHYGETYRLVYTQIEDDGAGYESYSPQVTIHAHSSVKVGRVDVLPASTTLRQGETQQFSATVVEASGGLIPQPVTWSVSGGQTSRIDASGLLTVGKDEEPTTVLTITATSVFDPTKSGTATVAITGAGILHVTETGAGTRDGSSWANAIAGLAEAIDIARQANEDFPGTVAQIWVAKGTYKPGLTRNDTFRVTKNVQILGGFAGTELLVSQRNPSRNVTVLSGDIGVEGDATDNVYHVVKVFYPENVSGSTAIARLDGFTITGGYAGDKDAVNEYSQGAGIYISNNHGLVLDFANLIITGNYAYYSGGGVQVSGDAVFTNVLIYDNVSECGAVFVSMQTRADFINVTIANNRRERTSYYQYSAGLVVNHVLPSYPSTSTMTNCIVWGNRPAIANTTSPSHFAYVPVHTYNSLVEGYDLATLIPGQGNLYGGTTEISPVGGDDPMFADPENGDFSLLPGSPCINAGNNDFVSGEYDLGWSPRIAGTAVDMGAYEYRGAFDTPTGLVWDGLTARWNTVDGAGGYRVTVYKDAALVASRNVTSNTCDFASVIDNTGPGGYYFFVQAYGSTMDDSGLSSRSPKLLVDNSGEPSPVNVDEVADTLENLLQNVGGLHTNIIHSTLAGMEDLDQCLQDSEILDIVEQLEEAYAQKNNISTTVNVAGDVADSIDQSKISIVGAMLNATSGAVTLAVNPPAQQVGISSRYTNTVRLNISLSGTGVKETQLVMPVRVTIPIPQGIVEGRFRVLHYHSDGAAYDVIIPTLNGDGTASFTLTRFSEFVLGEEGDGVSVSGQIRSYNPGNATTVTLYEAGHAGDAQYSAATATIEAASGSGQMTQEFTLEGIAEGSYDMVVTKLGHLSYTITGITVGGEAIDLKDATGKAYSTITLLAGDVNGDGWINSSDISQIVLAANYNKQATAAGVNANADISGDGWINSSDISILVLAAHFNKSNVVYQY